MLWKVGNADVGLGVEIFCWPCEVPCSTSETRAAKQSSQREWGNRWVENWSTRNTTACI